MINIGLAFVTIIVLVLSISGIFVCKNEIGQKLRPASTPSEASSKHSEKQTPAQRKLQKTRHAYAKERLKQRIHLEKEIYGLDRLLEEKSIDKPTYARYRKLLEMGYEEKRQQTRERYGFIQSLTTVSQA